MLLPLSQEVFTQIFVLDSDGILVGLYTHVCLQSTSSLLSKLISTIKAQSAARLTALLLPARLTARLTVLLPILTSSSQNCTRSCDERVMINYGQAYWTSYSRNTTVQLGSITDRAWWAMVVGLGLGTVRTELLQ